MITTILTSDELVAIPLMCLLPQQRTFDSVQVCVRNSAQFRCIVTVSEKAEKYVQKTIEEETCCDVLFRIDPEAVPHGVVATQIHRAGVSEFTIKAPHSNTLVSTLFILGNKGEKRIDCCVNIS